MFSFRFCDFFLNGDGSPGDEPHFGVQPFRPEQGSDPVVLRTSVFLASVIRKFSFRQSNDPESGKDDQEDRRISPERSGNFGRTRVQERRPNPVRQNLGFPAQTAVSAEPETDATIFELFRGSCQKCGSPDQPDFFGLKFCRSGSLGSSCTSEVAAVFEVILKQVESFISRFLSVFDVKEFSIQIFQIFI